jgi:fatty acid desaturase
MERKIDEFPLEARALDSFVGNIPVELTKQELHEFSTLDPLRSSFHIVGEWILIIAAVVVCRHFWSPVLYVLTIAFIGARQHALLILMHDGVHYRLFRNRRLNEWIAEIVLGWPCLISARAYRRNHFAHHRYLDTERDPDWARRQGDPAWEFPKRWPDLLHLLLRDLSGLNGIALLRLARSLMSTDTGVSTGFLAARYGFYAAALLAIVYLGIIKIVLFYWLVPFFTWLIMIFRVRSIAEHTAIEGQEGAYGHIRTTHLGLLERIFVAPKNVSYHIEHHFYPSVPFYRLPELHRLLLSKAGFQASAHLTRTYLGVLRECVSYSRASLNPDHSPNPADRPIDVRPEGAPIGA